MLLRLLQRHHLFNRFEEMEARLHTVEVKAMNSVALSEELYDKAIHAIKRHEKRDRPSVGGRGKDLDQQTDPVLDLPPVDEISQRVRARRGLQIEDAG
jgi:hypothetical protein